MSEIILTIGMCPIVFLKNSSSMVSPETFLKLGNSNNNFPNLKGCPGWAEEIYLFKVSCVSSWIPATFVRSVKTLSSVWLGLEDELGFSKEVLKSRMVRKHAYSWWSSWNCRMLVMMSWNSCTFCRKAVWFSSLCSIPEACTKVESSVSGRNWAEPKTKSSLQLSSNSNSWSENGSKVNDGMLLVHCTFIKRSRAADSQTAAGFMTAGGKIGAKGRVGNCKKIHCWFSCLLEWYVDLKLRYYFSLYWTRQSNYNLYKKIFPKNRSFSSF